MNLNYPILAKGLFLFGALCMLASIIWQLYLAHPQPDHKRDPRNQEAAK